MHEFDDGAQHFEPAQLSCRVLRSLQDLLRGERGPAAFVVRKSDVAAPDWRFCLVIVERAKGIGQPDAQSWWAELRERIELPCPFMVIDLAHPLLGGQGASRWSSRCSRCRTRRSTLRAADRYMLA